MLESFTFFFYIDIARALSIFLLMIVVMLILTSRANMGYLTQLLPNYDSPQKIHEHEVSRLGGLVMAIGITSMIISMEPYHNIKELMAWFSLAFLPLGLITLAEDLHKPISPRIRLAVMFGVSWLLLEMTGISLPLINTPYLSYLLADPLVRTVFYTLCLAAIMNGMNFVDGTNGNFAFMSISMLISLFYLATIVGDTVLIHLVITIAIPMVAFTLVNYPWGRIFAGDLGAYLYGALIGFFILFFFGRHSDISAWNALLITFYPIAELTYSFIRKASMGQSPLKPDRKHLHIRFIPSSIAAAKTRGCPITW
jgi:UDP-GlcNAc:undecaprenyl-phosphate/decaprenyl-phosphate GlcNAc-1-phosphate transferase